MKRKACIVSVTGMSVKYQSDGSIDASKGTTDTQPLRLSNVEILNSLNHTSVCTPGLPKEKAVTTELKRSWPLKVARRTGIKSKNYTVSILIHPSIKAVEQDPMPTIFTNIKYIMEDTRLKKPTRRYWFKRTRGNDAFLCSFGEDCIMIGYDGKLWRLHDFPSTYILYDFFTPDKAWYSKIKENPTLLKLEVSSTNPGKWHRKNEYRFECDICNGYEPWRGREPRPVHYAWMENITHSLIRLQRWIRRVVIRQGRARLALLMGLHPRLGQQSLLGELGHDMLVGMVLQLAYRL